MTRAYGFLMRLYPRKHRAVFEKEMKAVFEEAAEEHRRRGWVYFVRFMLAEMAGSRHWFLRAVDFGDEAR